MEDTSEELLLDTDGEQESTFNNPMVDMLANINQNMQQMSESLKRLHGADEAESAKKVKKSRPLPESGSTASITNNDVVDLLQEGEEEVNNDGQEVDVLDEIAQSLNEAEKTGEAVSEKLANIANKSWLHKLSEEQLREKSQKYPRPSNCTKLIASPKVNEEIWSKLQREARGKDLKLSRLQTTMSKTAYIAVNSADLMLKLKTKVDRDVAKELNNLVVMTTDSLQLLGHASFELSQVRRDEIKPNLHKDYGDLCSSSTPVTELLFGDDLQTQLTHIRAANKISNTAGKSYSQKRSSHSHNSKYTKPFLGRTTPTQSRQNYNYNNKARNFPHNYNRTKRAEQTKK